MEFKKNLKYTIIGVIALLVIAMVTAGDTVITNTGLTADTVDTGQGSNELYDMDQNVLTSSSPTFNGGTFSSNIEINSISTEATSTVQTEFGSRDQTVRIEDSSGYNLWLQRNTNGGDNAAPGLRFSRVQDGGIVREDDRLGYIEGWGYDGDEFYKTSGIEFITAPNPTDNSISGEIAFTTGTGFFNQEEAVRIDENQEVDISSISSDGTGSVVCIKSDGNLGSCTDQPDASGDCTCT